VERLNEPFAKGAAFPFIRRLLKLNQRHPVECPVEVIVLSRNDPDTGRRFYRSCQHYELAITRGAFLTGRSPHCYLASFNASLFLSASRADVNAAIEAGLPAGLVLPSDVQDDDADEELRVAFDFDGVVADDEAERV
jgi:5'-nucleotidase